MEEEKWTQWGMPCEHRDAENSREQSQGTNGGIHKPQDTADYQQPHKPGKAAQTETPARPGACFQTSNLRTRKEEICLKPPSLGALWWQLEETNADERSRDMALWKETDQRRQKKLVECPSCKTFLFETSSVPLEDLEENKTKSRDLDS